MWLYDDHKISDISYLIYSADHSFHFTPREGETEQTLTVIVLPKDGEDRAIYPALVAVVDKSRERLLVEDVDADDPRRSLWEPQALGRIVQLRAELLETAPAPPEWWKYHAWNCGIEYRDCAPFCPKDQYERTGHWDPRLRPTRQQIIDSDTRVQAVAFAVRRIKLSDFK